MDHAIDAPEDNQNDVFGQGAMQPFVSGARFFCLAFAFITPNILLLNHVWGG